MANTGRPAGGASPRRHDAPLAALCGLVGLGALGGGIGLMVSGLAMDPDLLSPLPVHSWVLPGLALLALVAIPMLGAAAAIARERPEAPARTAVAGALLLGWIAVQIAVIGPSSWLQPAMAMAGLAALIGGLRAGAAPRSGARRHRHA